MAFDDATGTGVLFGGCEQTGGITRLDETWTWDGTGWTRQFPAHSPSPECDARVAYDSKRQEVVLFGGSSGHDTWTWDGFDWTKQAPADHPPRLAAMAYDGATDTVVGFLVGWNGSQYVGETWTWDGSDWTKENPATNPSSQYSSEPLTSVLMAYDGENQQVVLFGSIETCPTNACDGDTWTWDGSDWTRQTPTTNPTARYAASIAYDSDHHRVILFGGETDSEISNDTWTWDGSDWTHEAPANKPPGRSDASMTFDPLSHRAILFGGFNSTSDARNQGDWWTWDGSDWTQQSPGTNPPPSDYPSMAYDGARQNVLLFGGGDGAGHFYGTWTWDGGVWTERSPADSPSRRWRAAVAYDPQDQQIVLFGGQANGGALDDTWTWDGTTWTKHTPSNTPPARILSSMAYDPNSGRVLLFGGRGDSGLLDDTWTWDGSDWRKEDPVHAPPARRGASMATDDALHQVVLFGGEGAGPTPDRCCPPLNDTWTWDGSDWSQQNPPASPPERAYAPMAYDPSTATIVLFGGGPEPNYRGDTWEWDGTTWTELFPASSPTPRAAAAMAFDSSGNALVFGGFDADPGPDGSSLSYGMKPNVALVLGKHGGTVATKNSLDRRHPVATSAKIGLTRAGGTVSILQTRSTETAPPGFIFLKPQVVVAAPPARLASPSRLVFELAHSVVGIDPGAKVHVFRTSTFESRPAEVPHCNDPSPPGPDPCVSSERTLSTGAVKVTVMTTRTATWNFAFPGLSLSVSKQGSGTGTVTSKPWGIVCGSVCRAGFLPGTDVSLTPDPQKGSVFKGWGGDCSGTGTCKLSMRTASAVTASFVHRPDAAIKLGADTRYVGTDIYNATATDQTRAVAASRGTTSVFDVAVHNRGSAADGYTLKAPGSTTDFSVKYLAGKTGTKNITDAVVAGTYTPGRIAAGRTQYMRMVISVGKTAAVGSRFARLVTARSIHDGRAMDAVKGAVSVGR
jgi:Divergent InlB B-repeat domain/Galactose oxidase, central domain